jgi:hypothetical protein
VRKGMLTPLFSVSVRRAAEVLRSLPATIGREFVSL